MHVEQLKNRSSGTDCNFRKPKVGRQVSAEVQTSGEAGFERDVLPASGWQQWANAKGRAIDL